MRIHLIYIKTFGKFSKREIIYFLLILVCGFILRIANLNAIPVFGDEAIYIHWAQVMKVDATMRFLPLTDGKQPLFMWVIIPFLKIIEDPLIAGRVVSVFTGMGTLLGVFALVQILFKSTKISLLASLVYAISPFALFFDRLALADSMLTFFGIWAFVFSILFVKTRRLDFSMFSGFSLGGALLTKSPAIFFAMLLPLSLIFIQIQKGKVKFRKIIKTVLLFIPAYIISFGLYNILRLGPQFHQIALRNQDYVYPLSHVFTSPLDPLVPFLIRSSQYLWYLGPTFLILLIILGMYHGLKHHTKETIYVFLLAAIPLFAVTEYSKVLTARYIFFSFPYFCILASIAIGVIPKHLLGGLALHLKKALFVLFFLNALVFDLLLLTKPQKAYLPRSERSGFLEEWTSGYGIREVAKKLEGITEEKGENIYVGTEGYFGTLPNGLQMYLFDNPKIEVFGTGLDFESVPEELTKRVNEGKEVYFVVNSDRLHADYQDLNLELISFYHKVIRPDSSFQSLYFFKVE